MNEEQYKRYRKMMSEPIKCLHRKKDSKNNLYFLINNSSDKNYKIKISQNGKIECSCPDFTKGGAKIEKCICKHCLFVIFKILKIFQDINHTFFKRCFFTPDEIKNINKIIN